MWLSIKVLSLSYSPAARSDPFRWVFLPTSTFSSFAVIDERFVCFIFVFELDLLMLAPTELRDLSPDAKFLALVAPE